MNRLNKAILLKRTYFVYDITYGKHNTSLPARAFFAIVIQQPRVEAHVELCFSRGVYTKVLFPAGMLRRTSIRRIHIYHIDYMDIDTHTAGVPRGCTYTSFSLIYTGLVRFRTLFFADDNNAFSAFGEIALR